MPSPIEQKIIKSFILEGEMISRSKIVLKIDQTICQDAIV